MWPPFFKVAFLGLGRDGLSDGRTTWWKKIKNKKGGSRGDVFQPPPRPKAKGMGRKSSGNGNARPPTTGKPRAEGAGFSSFCSESSANDLTEPCAPLDNSGDNGPRLQAWKKESCGPFSLSIIDQSIRPRVSQPLASLDAGRRPRLRFQVRRCAGVRGQAARKKRVAIDRLDVAAAGKDAYAGSADAS